ncbi:MAG: PAS domain-containing protein [Ardenticatenaceae bacterium]|nr:PAS domain-containing protein [Ardenticatenaceae bacterium]
MPLELWGAAGTTGLSWPDHPLEYLLLLLYAGLLAYIVYAYRAHVSEFNSREWGLFAGLSVIGLLTSQLFPIPLSFENQLAPVAVAQNPMTVLAPFTAVPLLLAAASLNPLAALGVGLVTGLGTALGQTHQVYAIFHGGFTAVLAYFLLRQNYQGRLFRWLRLPVVAGPLSMAALAIPIGLATFVEAVGVVSTLTAVDLAISTATANLLPLLLEGVLGGVIVMLILLGVPQLAPPPRPLRPTPWQRSLRNRLLTNFVLFVGLVLILMVFVVYNVAVNVSTRLVVNQMAHDAQTVSSQIPDFRANLQNLLALYNDDAQLLVDDSAESEKVLQQLFRVNPFYRRILLVNADQTISAFYPEDVDQVTLSDREKVAVAAALQGNQAETTTAPSPNDEYVLSFVVPVLSPTGEPGAALVGRVPSLSLNDLIIGLKGTVGRGAGFILDENEQVVAHADPNQLLRTWRLPDEIGREIVTSETAPGVAYQGREGQTNARELVYFIRGETHPWTVVVTAPYESVLNLAVGIGVPLALAMVVITAVFYIIFALMGRDITQPITELVNASETLAAGGNWRPEIIEQRDDEIGQLTKAFAHMQRSIKQRLNELSLLLGVSHDVSASIDITQGMPAILRGAVRGSGAAGARAVITSPSGGHPVTFGEGAAVEDMAVLDRPIRKALRRASELLLETPQEIRTTLQLDEKADLPVAALLALPLYAKERFQGVLWLGYRSPHAFDSTERSLLKTLAGQAAVLVDNARLYATAESGRRRLSAVLESTSDAVIVTDRTQRILLVNRATEQLFQLKASEVNGRPVADVIPVQSLVDALTNQFDQQPSREIPLEDGRVFYTSTSTIIGNDGQVMGRVAVLHDISHLKEIDAMKSDFVSTVSHDLRSPLTFMRGYATMLPMVGELNDKQQDYVDKIMGGIDQMAKLVNDLLDLGRIESGVKLRNQTIEVEPLLADLATEYWQHAHLNGIKLEVGVEPKELVLVADKPLLRQALTNLLTNAIKYAPDSGDMKLCAERVNNEVVFSVADHGPGIPEQDQMRLFERFYRVKERGTEKVKGSGLGLAIVKSIAERHGGRAWCQSKRGQGSTFYIAIPINLNGYEE